MPEKTPPQSPPTEPPESVHHQGVTPQPATEAAGPALKANPQFVTRTRVLTLVLLSTFTLAVTGIGFALSFSGLYDWAGSHGYKDWQRWAWPITVDAGILIGELALFSIALDGIRAKGRKLIGFDMVFFFTLVAGGWSASLAFNVLEKGGGMGSHVSAAFPPLLAMVGLFVFLRTVHRYTSGDHDAMMRANELAAQRHQFRQTRQHEAQVNAAEVPPAQQLRPELPAEPRPGITQGKPEPEPEGSEVPQPRPEPEPEEDPEDDPDPDDPTGGGAPDLSDPGAKKTLVLSGLREHRGRVSGAMATVREAAPALSVSEGYAHEVKRKLWLPDTLDRLFTECAGDETRVRARIIDQGYQISGKAVDAYLSERRGNLRHLRVAEG